MIFGVLQCSSFAFTLCSDVLSSHFWANKTIVLEIINVTLDFFIVFYAFKFPLINLKNYKLQIKLTVMIFSNGTSPDINKISWNLGRVVT